jgi:hypothetical protein
MPVVKANVSLVLLFPTCIASFCKPDEYVIPLAPVWQFTNTEPQITSRV